MRAQKELGLTCSRSTIWRIHRRGTKLRALADLADAQDFAEELAGSGASVADLRQSNLKLLLARLQEKILEGADVKEVAALGRLMLQSEEREIQRERALLARQRFEFKAAQAALKALPLADELKAEDEERELERIELIQRRIFGDELLAGMQFPPDDPGTAAHVSPHLT